MDDVPLSHEVPVIEWDFRFSPQQSVVLCGSSGYFEERERERESIWRNLKGEFILFLFFCCF